MMFTLLNTTHRLNLSTVSAATRLSRGTMLTISKILISHAGFSTLHPEKPVLYTDLVLAVAKTSEEPQEKRT